MPSLAWLTARPIAHRGLHDAAAGVVENTAAAFRAAIDSNYGIECDLQITADGEAMVHHDDALGRLTEGSERLADLSAAALKAVPFKTGPERMLTLGDLCDLAAGRAPLVLELKSQFNGDPRLARRVAGVLKHYRGPVAAMSFDSTVLDALREAAPGLARGIVAEGRYALHARAWRATPHFIAYNVKDLPAPAPLLARGLFGLPLLTWTVREPADIRQARRWADQVIFENCRP
jgi:glycerophosphoryl diester phosphodiesterase